MTDPTESTDITVQATTIQFQEYKDCGWVWSLGKDSHIVFWPTSKPNAFHRFTQRILLGIYWRKTDD
jgi:hypothetical protein